MSKTPEPTVVAPVDTARLTSLRGYADPGVGIAEEFLEERLGPEGAFALLASPHDADRPDLWIVCPSIGQEHGNLRRLEALVARSLAASGLASLRIRPDVGPGGAMRIDLDTRLAEVADAVALARREGTRVAGAIGMVSGALTAALTCEETGLDGLVAIEPVRRGRQYVRESLRRQAVNDLMTGPAEAAEATGTSPLKELEATGATSIRGLALDRGAYDRIAAIDLVADVKSFAGRSLLVGISPTGAVPPSLQALHDHLAALGGDVTVQVVEERLPVPLGEYHYENVGPVRMDTRLDLDRRLAELTTRWVAAPGLVATTTR